MNSFNRSPYRPYVLGVEEDIPLINNSTCIGVNFDNAATTPPLNCVMNDVVAFMPYYSSIHRGDGYKSKISTLVYDESRNYVRDFIGGNLQTEIIYVKNCTEAINLLANIMADKYRGSIVLSTTLEHHSNDLPWRKDFDIKYVDLNEDGTLNMEDLKQKLETFDGQVSLVTVTGASNVTGTKPYIYEIAELAHKHGAMILVDGAQLIPHDVFSLNLNSKDRYIDFLAFSGHKLYAPFGTGVLVGTKSFFEANNPHYVGGGTIDYVSHEEVIYTSPPDKDEAGSPNVVGPLAVASAIEQLQFFEMERIKKYETYLLIYLTERIKKLPSIILYGDYMNYRNKASILPFNIEGMHHTTVSKILSYEFGISVRSGCFCAHPYIQKLLKIPKEESKKLVLQPKELQPGMVRISLGMYNDISEIDKLLCALEIIISNKSYYNKKYSYYC